MTKFFKATAILALVLSASALGTGCIIVDDDSDDSTITIVNDSDFFLVDIAIAPAGLEYGPNLLGFPLAPGDELLLTDVECDFYDMRIEDEDGFVCELLDVDICFEDAIFFITNADLNNCGTFALRDPAKATDKSTEKQAPR